MLFQTPGFVTIEDVANRALQYCGAKRIGAITEISKNAKEITACYTGLRQAELRRHDWVFAIKRSSLRPVDVTSMEWTPPAWAIGTTYGVGTVVSADDGFGSRLWSSNSPGNVGNAPGPNSAFWDDYFGPTVAQPFTVATTYFAGDLVYEVQTDGTFKVYRSLMQGNSDDPSVTDAWDATVTYKKGAIAVVSAQNYISLVDDNINNPPASSATQWATTSIAGSYQWVLVGTALTALSILYPINSGPSSQTTTRNIFPLPYGFLKKVNQNPKAGSFSFLGAPSNAAYLDWIIEGRYLITSGLSPIVFRYTADVTKITLMDPMFCEGFAARIGLSVCEILTQSTEKLKSISGEYEKFMGEARDVDAIENDAEEAPLDDYIACRS
jgi:hypothetical protein